MESAKKTRGRQKVEMKAIADESKRHVAFSKRKAGLFNKAAELSLLTGTEVAAFVFSRRGKPYTFASPGSESSVAAWLRRRAGEEIPLPPENLRPDGAGDSARELRRLEDANKRIGDRRRVAGFWWESPESDLETVEEIEAFEAALVELRRKVETEALTRQAVTFPVAGEEIWGAVSRSPSSEIYN